MAGPGEVRLTLQLAGWTFDWSIEPTAAEAEDEPDPAAALNGGTTGGYYVGFAAHVAPEEVTAPAHCPSWDEPDE